MGHLRWVPAVSLALLAGSARAADFRGGLSAGLGLGHDFIGLQLELGAGHWSAFASAGPLKFSSLAIGGRWSEQPDGSGFGLALQAVVTK